MPFLKQRVPEYPRPVPSICTEEIPLCEDTVVYEEWRTDDVNDDCHEENDKRAVKRRRTIERCAHAYLRGDPVFILSATLKGPFGEGWKNPWRKKRAISGKKAKHEAKVVVKMEIGELEVPETNTLKINFPKAHQRSPIGGNEKRNTVEATPCAVPKRMLSPPSGIRDVDKKPVTGQQPTPSARRVEDWLKTNNAYISRQSPDKHSSPTPATTRRDPRPEIEVGSGRSLFGSKLHLASSAAEDHSRAEFAILQNKRRFTHTVPPSTNLPAFEYQRGGHPAKKKRRIDSLKPYPVKVASSEQVILGSEIERPLETTSDEGKLTSKPTLPTETSKENTINNLPSAQIAPAARLEAGASTIASIGNMLEVSEAGLNEHFSSAPHGGAQPVGGVEDQNKPTAKDLDMIQVDEPPATTAAATAITPGGRDVPTTDLDTQEILAAIVPFDISTVKKSVANIVEAETPLLATKVKATLTRKRASFVVDQISSAPPHGSIKTTMKVKKTTKESNTVSLKPSKYGKLGPDMETSDVGDLHYPTKNTSHRSFVSVLSTKKTSTPKGILKSSTVISSLAAPIPLTNTGSTSMKQDAQRVFEPPMEMPGAGAILEEDSFDLSAAIDDLGSYLGTWDPEKEASSIILSAGG